MFDYTIVLQNRDGNLLYNLYYITFFIKITIDIYLGTY